MKPKKPISNKPLTRKQQAFIKHLIDNPKDSATEAAAHTYNVSTRQTAEVIAYENLRKPQIVSELSKYNNLIENTLINTVSEWSTHEKPRQREIAIDTAKFIHDKIHGEAKQVTEVNSTALSFTIDMTAQDITEE